MAEKSINVRWMIRRDMPEVLTIENQSYESPWCEEEFIRCLRHRNFIGMTAEVDDAVVGFMIYELHKNRIHLLNIAVSRDFRRFGTGKAMIDTIKSKLTADRRNRVMLEVRETNVGAQLFFSASGFRAISVLRNYYEDMTEDAYLMQYRFNHEDNERRRRFSNGLNSRLFLMKLNTNQTTYVDLIIKIRRLEARQRRNQDSQQEYDKLCLELKVLQSELESLAKQLS